MCIAFFDACYFWAFFMDRFKCDLQLNRVLALTLFYRDDLQAIYEATKLMSHSQHIIYAFTYVTSLNLNICVSLDLIFMLKNPFKKSEARYRPFLYTSIVLGAIETIVLDLPHESATKSRIDSLINLGAYLGFVALGVTSILVSFNALSKPGCSLELRKLIFQRHFLYITAYIVCNTFTAISDINLLVFQNDMEHMHFDESKYLFVLSVIFFG